MLKRLRTNHPILYCLLAEVLFLVVLQLGQVVLLGIIMGLLYIGVLDIASLDDYLLSFIMELPGVAVGVVLLWRTGEAELMRRRGSGFFNGLLVGMYPFVLIAYNLAGSIWYSAGSEATRTPLEIGYFFISLIAVGVAEELVGRAVIAETLLEHYGTTRAGVWKACIVSGLFFGASHLINMLASEPFGVLMQCLFAAALGVLLAAIYFRSGNIWVVIVLHALMDIAALWQGGVYGTQTTAETISSYDITMLYSVLIYMVPVFYLLRKKKVGEVALYFGRDCAGGIAAKKRAEDTDTGE